MDRRKAVLALLLLVPVPSMGTLAGMVLLPGSTLGKGLSFSVHHFIALQAFCAAPFAVACSVGVFFGGATWSFMYPRYRSIWPGYLSHAVVDLCVFGIGAAMLFGGR